VGLEKGSVNKPKKSPVANESTDGLTAWDRAAGKFNKLLLETLRIWGTEVQVNLKNNFLSAND
jgi:hypothetical protein